MARHVLLIEPDVDTLGRLAEGLRQRGLSVVIASDVEEAGDRARAQRPHMVFLAGSLAERLETSAALDAVPELASVPRVVLVRDERDLAADRANYDDVERLVMRALAVRPPSSPPESSGEGELRGDLQQVALVDLLQLLAMNRRTGLLAVSTPAGAGELRVADGEVLDAVYRRLEGEKALFRLVAERQGRFVFTPGSPPPVARIGKGTSALLMEAMRQKDELERLRAEVSSEGVAFVAVGERPADEGHWLRQEIWRTLARPKSIDEVLDELPAADLEVLRTLRALVDDGSVREADQVSHQAPLCPPAHLPVLRALAARLAREGFVGPPRVVIAAAPARVHAFGLALGRVAGSASPAEPPPGVPVPHDLGVVRLGEGVEIAIVGLPVVDAFAPVWSLALPGAGALVCLDDPPSAALRAVCQSLEIALSPPPPPAAGRFDEGDPVAVASLLRAVIEQAGVH